ncbi:MAG: transketolase [Kiritimatiellia bacterium]
MPTIDYALAANTIRCLSMDAIEAARSGHPGAPLGLADVATVLWLDFLRHHPIDPGWANRDRFVLSGGHGSMLLYSLLHLSGYRVTLDDLRSFRQWGSCCAGHPERGMTEGVETTTGPLGQGIANAVGMAMAERMMAARFPGMVDHRTWCFCGDGDLMEGISHEACSLAGHLRLNRLVLFYDSNAITIEGSTALAVSDDVKLRFKGYGWNVLSCDGHDYDDIAKAIRKSLRSDLPTLIVCRTTIGKSAPTKAGTAASHGAPLGAEEVRGAKLALGFDPDATFVVPEGVRELFAKTARRNASAYRRWTKAFREWETANPSAAQLWYAHRRDLLPTDLESHLPQFDPSKPLSTRAASGATVNALKAVLPQLVGGSADLAPSNQTWLKSSTGLSAEDFSGSNIHYGVRELAMSAVMNGLSVYGGFRAYGGTFFVFSDYCKPALRVAALQKTPTIFVFTHDSFYVGEDGPTHQPVEQLPMLRATPNVTVIRPADATETAAAWVAALRNKEGPTALLLTRQNLPVLDRSVYPSASNLEKGAYVLWQTAAGTPELILIGTGSEVALCLEAAKRLEGVNVRVVSMPSWELFDKQTEAYRNSVLDPLCRRRLAVEAASSFGWTRYVCPCRGAVVGLDHFGASAPYGVLAEKFGFTVENVLAKARELLDRK